jgi:hypothetical protein
MPNNGAIMWERGVVSFKSDSNELARRLNTEAAKTVNATVAGDRLTGTISAVRLSFTIEAQACACYN